MRRKTIHPMEISDDNISEILGGSLKIEPAKKITPLPTFEEMLNDVEMAGKPKKKPRVISEIDLYYKAFIREKKRHEKFIKKMC